MNGSDALCMGAFCAAACVVAFAPPVNVPPPSKQETPSQLSSHLHPTADQRALQYQILRERNDRAHYRVRLPKKSLQAFAQPTPGGNPSESSPDRAYPPLDVTAQVQAGQIRLSWVANPRNPVGRIHYEIQRWRGVGRGEVLPLTRASEIVESTPCEGMTYLYKVRSVFQTDPSSPTLTSNPAETSCVVPRTSVWSAKKGRLEGTWDLFQKKPGQPDQSFEGIRPGSPLGKTSWRMELATLRETTISSETSIPRFDALGRRVIINGQPAARTRARVAHGLLASLRLIDPCGISFDFEQFLPKEE